MSPDTIVRDTQKSSLMIDKHIWKEIRLQAIREDKEIGKLIEDMFREKYLKQPQYQPYRPQLEEGGIKEMVRAGLNEIEKYRDGQPEPKRSKHQKELVHEKTRVKQSK